MSEEQYMEIWKHKYIIIEARSFHMIIKSFCLITFYWSSNRLFANWFLYTRTSDTVHESYEYFLLQLFGLISSMLLFCTVRHKRTSHTYKSYDPTTWLLREGDEHYRRCQPLWGNPLVSEVARVVRWTMWP